MAGMKRRLTVSLTPEQDSSIVQIRKRDEFCRMSYSQILRILVNEGLKVAALNTEAEVKKDCRSSN